MSDRTTLARLLAEHWPAIRPLMVECGCAMSFLDYDGYATHLADLITAEFLIVPRSDIVGTEYGWVHDILGERCEHDALSEADALRLAGESGAALSRTVLPWSAIPLPENGES